MKPLNEGEMKASIEIALYKNRMEAHLRKALDQLKDQMRKRISELESTNITLKEKIGELENLQRLTVGREIKMIELKEEVSCLQKELLKYKKER